jgi:RimJ/RimL family protein N-acetyltransferase
MNRYKVLTTQQFSSGGLSLVPIRMEDRYDIMKWRNEQLYHLRQNKPLTEQEQYAYFKNVIAKLFDQEQPDQILFSFLKEDQCIGYGGLVHVNWIDKNAEISFIIDTKLEGEEFELHWLLFLDLIEKIGFGEINLHKLFVYAFDLRPHLYEVLGKAGYFEDARLNEHCLVDNIFRDVVIYSKLNT